MTISLEPIKLKPENNNYDFKILAGRPYHWIKTLTNKQFSKIIGDRISVLQFINAEVKLGDKAIGLTEHFINSIEKGNVALSTILDDETINAAPVEEISCTNIIKTALIISKDTDTHFDDTDAFESYIGNTIDSNPEYKNHWLFKPASTLVFDTSLDVSIDVSAKDEVIFESLKTLLTQHRKRISEKLNIEFNLRKASKRHQLEEYKIIQMLDLYILAKAKGVKLSGENVLNIVFKDDYDIGLDTVRNHIKRHLKPLLTPHILNKTLYQITSSKD